MTIAQLAAVKFRAGEPVMRQQARQHLVATIRRHREDIAALLAHIEALDKESQAVYRKVLEVAEKAGL